MIDEKKLAQELIQKWNACLIRLKNKEYANSKECMALLGEAAEYQFDLRRMGYTCLDGLWLHPSEGN
jgi:hypothetical protein